MTTTLYLSAYRSVLSVCSQQFIPGEIIAICAHYYYCHKITQKIHTVYTTQTQTQNVDRSSYTEQAVSQNQICLIC